jgi:hypothetical protein
MITIINIVNIGIDTFKVSYSNGFFDYICESEKDVLVKRFNYKSNIDSE